MKKPASSDRIKRDIEAISLSAMRNGDGITRLSYSTEHAMAIRYLACECHQLGMSCHLDGIGNFIARLGNDETACKSAYCLGSHIDSVINGGKFDGTAGIIAGIETLRILTERGVKVKHPLQLIAFTEEEGVRFNSALAGSRFFTGEFGTEILKTWRTPEDDLLEALLTDFEKNLKDVLDGTLPKSCRNMDFFIEPHVEQGPVLTESGDILGIVTSITGTSMTEITFSGEANHAGTTPMGSRKDPVRGLIYVANLLEKRVQKSGNFIATIGKIQLEPNVSNVIPSKANFTVDLRSAESDVLCTLLQELEDWCHQAAQTWSLQYKIRTGHKVMPTEMDPQVQACLMECARKRGVPSRFMTSGAGHDALSMSAICSVGMIFVPSIGGKSHCPEESTNFDHLALAAEILADFITAMDSRT